MKRTDEHQKFIMVALEERDIHQVRSIGQALKLSAPTCIKREDLVMQIESALREGSVNKTEKRFGRPPKNAEGGVNLLKGLDEEYFKSKQAPLRQLSNTKTTYQLPSVKLSDKSFAKIWADNILRGHRVLLYCILPESIRSALSMINKHLAKQSEITAMTIICDIAPELIEPYKAELGGEVVATHFGMPTETQSRQIVGKISSALDSGGHTALMVDDIGRLAAVCATGPLNFEDCVRILCSLAMTDGIDSSMTVILGTSNDEFVKQYSRLFNHVIKI